MNDSSREAQAHELVAEVRHIAEEIRPLTDSVDSLYMLLQHIWQNREEFLDLLSSACAASEGEALPDEVVFCTACDKTMAGLAQALRSGWQYLLDDEGNERGNYAAMCGECIEREDAGSATEDADKGFCCARPELRWDGDPDAPNVCCAQCGFVVMQTGQAVLPSASGKEVPSVVNTLIRACKAALAVEEQIGPHDSVVGRHETLIQTLRNAIREAEPSPHLPEAAQTTGPAPKQTLERRRLF